MNVIKNELQQALTESLVRHNVAGASVAILHEGDVTAVAAGTINVNTGVELTPETVMHIGSITKVFNATLVMQLVDEGKVDLDERVVRYLPDLRLKDREALEQITVKMLLNHTSGIDGEWLPDYGHDEETIEKAISRITELGQLFRPGAEFSYCNIATVIAGYLVQRLRGKSWYRLVSERIFAPLQMEEAVTLPEEALLRRASVGHHLNPANRQLVRSSFAFLSLSLAPAGSTLMMSAKDLITFARAHMALGVGPNGARVLSAHNTKAMQRMTVNNKGKGYMYTDGMGIGWLVSSNGLLFHAGGGPGIISVLYVYPEQEFAAAILTNAAHGLSVINEFMEPWLKEIGDMKPFGMANIQAPSKEVKVDSNKYVGTYEDILERYDVSRLSDGLALSIQTKLAIYDSMSTKPTRPVRLIPLGDERFLLGSDAKDDNSLSTAARIFTFRNLGPGGHMEYLGKSLRLYKRAS